MKILSTRWGMALILMCGAACLAIVLIGRDSDNDPLVSQTTRASDPRSRADERGTAPRAPVTLRGSAIASPFSPAPPGVQYEPGDTRGPAEQLLDVPGLRKKWADEPDVEKKIEDAIAVTKLQDRVGGVGRELEGLSLGKQRELIAGIVLELQSYADRGLVLQRDVEEIAATLKKFTEPASNVSQAQPDR